MPILRSFAIRIKNREWTEPQRDPRPPVAISYNKSSHYIIFLPLCQPLGKEKRAHIILKAPDRLECALWDYYENLEAWSKIDFQSSYVDFVFGVQHTVGGRDYFALANNELYWSLPITQNLADICRRDWSIIKNYGFLTWGGKMDKFVDLSKTLRIKEN